MSTPKRFVVLAVTGVLVLIASESSYAQAEAVDCCLPNGQCLEGEVDAASCSLSGGAVVPEGESCSSFSCPDQERACCLDSETCFRTTPAACDDFGGRAFPDNDACEEVNCAAPQSCVVDGDCDDGRHCTGVEGCVDGLCVSEGNPCLGGPACQTDCVEKSQACLDPAGAPCDDGDPCTDVDSCDGSGACTGTPVECPAGFLCDPGSGQCISNDPCEGVDCSALDDACNEGRCDPVTGECVAEPIRNGLGCNDGLDCTTEDVCFGGKCSGGDICPGVFGDVCNDSSCSAQTGECETVPRADGTPCNNGLFCDGSDTCSSGVCTPIGLDPCFLIEPQCADTCDEALDECVFDPAGEPCDDRDACTFGDACDGNGTCRAAPKDCSPLADECNDASCNERTGECDVTPKPDGTSCADTVFCDGEERCRSGVCEEPGDPCVTGPQCADFCSEEGGCFDPAGAACEDFDNCSVGETCDGLGRCTGGEPLDCSALDDACHVGVCDAATGECEARRKPDGTPCPDGRFCNGAETCVEGACISPGDPCPPGVPCRSTCDESLDSCADVAGTPCDDDANCTRNDACDGRGACVGTPTECPRGEFCDPSTGRCEEAELNCCQLSESCTTLAPELCEASGGVAVRQAFCDELSRLCDSDLTDCCEVDGRCSTLDPFDCEAIGGRSVQGAGCDAQGGTCRKRLGTCCELVQGCAEETPEACGILGGTVVEGAFCDESTRDCAPFTVFEQVRDLVDLEIEASLRAGEGEADEARALLFEANRGLIRLRHSVGRECGRFGNNKAFELIEEVRELDKTARQMLDRTSRGKRPGPSLDEVVDIIDEAGNLKLAVADALRCPALLSPGDDDDDEDEDD